MNIVITGASRGIGKAIAEAFAADQQAHTLVLNARNEALLTQLKVEWKEKYPQCKVEVFAGDFSEEQVAKELAHFAIEVTDGKIDILVNNAGNYLPGNVSTEEPGVLEAQIQNNLFSAYYLTRNLLGVMKAHQSGHIFNMCSIASLKAYPNGGAYSISKFALDGFNKNLREELKPYKIKVTAVYPGAVMTDSWEGFDNSDGRIMEASDVAKMIYATAHLSPQACVEEIVLRPVLGDL